MKCCILEKDAENKEESDTPACKRFVAFLDRMRQPIVGQKSILHIPLYKLPFEIYTFWKNLSNRNFRKKPSFSQGTLSLRSYLTLPPTSPQISSSKDSADYHLN